jgi:hypothetical protein
VVDVVYVISLCYQYLATRTNCLWLRSGSGMAEEWNATNTRAALDPSTLRGYCGTEIVSRTGIWYTIYVLQWQQNLESRFFFGARARARRPGPFFVLPSSHEDQPPYARPASGPAISDVVGANGQRNSEIWVRLICARHHSAAR